MIGSAGIAIIVGGLAGCFAPRDDGGGPGLLPPRDLFSSDATPAPVCPPGDPSPLARLEVALRTSAVGGRFAPRNVGAIWISRADGGFVKTLARWGYARAKWLTRFVAETHGDVVDAVTSATLVSHQVHRVTWPLTDVAGCEVAPGEYRVVAELTDRDGTGATIDLPFSTADGLPATTSYPDAPTFHDLVLTLR